MLLKSFSVISFLSLAGSFASSQAFACGFGLRDFACCESASFAGAPEMRFGSGCAVSRADATARCVAMSAARPDFRVEWGSSQCRSGGGGSGSSNPAGHACSVARRGDNSFTYYYYSTSGTLTKDQLCSRARGLNDTGRAITHTWYTTFTPGKLHKAIAECQNGTWVAYDYGIDSIKKVNELRKQGGGKGCLFKVDKNWQQ